MDFNTGSSGRRPEDESRPLYGGEAGGQPPSTPSRGPAGGAGREFSLQDPVGSFISTVRSLILDPVNFFRGAARRGNLIDPLAFVAICSAIGAIPFAIVLVLLSLFAGDPSAFLGALVFSLLFLIAFPIGAVVSALINAGIYHLVVYLLMRQRNAGFGATLRVVCYAAFTLLLFFLFLIPILGILIALLLSVYALVLLVLGIREMHGASTGQAVVVVLAPVAVAVVLSLVFGVLAVIVASLA